MNMDYSQEIQHWLARNNLQELSQRFQAHKINSVRRLVFLNPMLIKELIPEIGLRLDFMECWSQFKLRGTLRDNYEGAPPEYTPRPISYLNSPNLAPNPPPRPLEIFELHPLQQGANVNIVNYTQRQNVSQAERYNVTVPESPNTSISYNVAPRLVQKSSPGSVELVELDPVPEGHNYTGEPSDTKSAISIQDPRSLANIPGENPFECILGHSSEGQSIDSGWDSNCSTILSPETVHQNKRKVDKPDSSNAAKQSKSDHPISRIQEMDMKSYLMNFDAYSRAAVTSYQKKGVLCDKGRSSVCNAVARRLMLNEAITAEDYACAAQKICELFPTECEILYYCPPETTDRKRKPSGKLVNKVKNIKHSSVLKKL